MSQMLLSAPAKDIAVRPVLAHLAHQWDPLMMRYIIIIVVIIMDLLQ